MAASHKKRRPNGSLAALKRGLWSVFLRNVEFVEDEAQPIEIRLQASTAAVQSGLAFSKVVEQHEMQEQMEELRQMAQGNGHLS